MSAEGSATPESSSNSTASAGESPKINKFVIILSAMNLLITLGILGALFLSLKKEREHAAVEDISLQAEASGKHEGGGEHGEHGEHGEKGEGLSLKSAFSKAGEKMLSLEQFTVNLSTPGSSSPKFVRASISLEVPNEDTENELTTKAPQVRNVIIDLFNSKKATDLSTVEGREYLKEEIKSSLNGFLLSGKIKGVFFTSFSLSG
jgi:flagellar FliL protein